MMFWITVFALTLGATALGFLPALRPRGGFNLEPAVAEFDYDIAVYRDQLTELENEQARGLIARDEAGQARVEVVRRLLAAEEKRKLASGVKNTEKADRFSKVFLLAVSLLFVPGLAFLLYTSIGSPTLEAQPLAARLEAAREEQIAQDQNNAQLLQLVKKAEAHLRSSPEDGRGWDVLAPIYVRIGENQKAVDAYVNALRILGETAPRLSGLGEARVALAEGQITSEALELFQKALTQNPIDGRSLYYTSIGMAQRGRVVEAFEGLQVLALNEAVEGEWRVAAAQTIAQINESNNINNTPANDQTQPPALDQETIDQANNMPAEDRTVMIVSMVERLEKRLADQGGSVEEWQRLIRAHTTLNQRQKAIDALNRAVNAFAGKNDEVMDIRRFAEDLGLVLGVTTTQ